MSWLELYAVFGCGFGVGVLAERPSHQRLLGVDFVDVALSALLWPFALPLATYRVRQSRSRTLVSRGVQTGLPANLPNDWWKNQGE